MIAVTPELLLRAYACGLFPMSEGRNDPRLFWIDPDQRGIIPLSRFHVPRRLARRVRQGAFEVRYDTAFDAVVDACAKPTEERSETWINDRIISLYRALHADKHAHSVECWRDERLVGGLYGVALGAAFFGESMFTRETDASKVALVHLVRRLKQGGFRLLDVQFLTNHLQIFGAVEVSREVYHDMLGEALRNTACFYPGEGSNSVGGGDSFLQSTTQMS